MCSVTGCFLPAKSGSDPLCKKHYMRQWRYGTTELTAKKAKKIPHSAGYILVPALGHKLAKGSSHAYEHRIVYFDAHGDGPFNCHWCEAVINWDGLHIDHLDDDKKNNSIGNLVASCPQCNQARGHEKCLRTWAAKSGITAFGKTLTPNQWAEELGISRTSILWRLRRGWSAEDAVSKPRGKYGPK